MQQSFKPDRRAGRLGGRAAALLALAASAPLALAEDSKSPSDGTDSLRQAQAIMSASVAPVRVSQATDARAYRKDAASHLYGMNRDRVFKGKMPPLLYAVGVLQVEVDPVGQVRSINWMRAPNHAPEVMADIERMVRAAAPFPAPSQMGGVTYTDVWLWHKSGRFQLDTLTEGQL